MVNEPAYAPPLSQATRHHIRAAVDALIVGKGVTETFSSRLFTGDSAFVRRLPETSMNIRTYDQIMGRISALWPNDLEWPADVPRPEPLPIEDALRADLEVAIIRQAAIEAAKKAREARSLARAARQVAQHVSPPRSTKKTAGGEQAPAQT